MRLDTKNDPLIFERKSMDPEVRHAAKGGSIWRGIHSQPVVEKTFHPLCALKLLAPGSVTVRELARKTLIALARTVI